MWYMWDMWYMWYMWDMWNMWDMCAICDICDICETPPLLRSVQRLSAWVPPQQGCCRPGNHKYFNKYEWNFKEILMDSKINIYEILKKCELNIE